MVIRQWGTSGLQALPPLLIGKEANNLFAVMKTS
jgi:hypothetical protein